jgi:hypothetical protein
MSNNVDVSKTLETLNSKTKSKNLGKTFGGVTVHLFEDKKGQSDSNILFGLSEDDKLTLVNIFDGAMITINKWTAKPWYKSIIDNPIPYNISQIGNSILSCFVSSIDFDKKNKARKFQPLSAFTPDKGRFTLPDFCLTIFNAQVTIDLDRHDIKLVGTYVREEDINGELDDKKISWVMKDKNSIYEWSYED